MDKIYSKFGGYYVVDEMTFVIGTDIRFTDHLARRMKNRVVLCSAKCKVKLRGTKYLNL